VKPTLSRRLMTSIAIVAMAMALLLPNYAIAQGRGHGRGLSKKSAKFINRHDARAGRWDGRGPTTVIGASTARHRGRHRVRLIRKHKRVHVRGIRR
jgi:hypothetical protein